MKKITPTTKRKIAGIIAVVLIVAMILSAVLPLFLRTAYAEEPQQFTVEAQMGFNGFVKKDCTAPVDIKVTNNGGKDFKGKVVLKEKKSLYSIEYYNSKNEGDNTPEYFAQIELAAGETKQIKGRVPVNTTASEMKISLVNNKDKEIYETSISVAADREDAKWLGVISDSDRTRVAAAANFSEFGRDYDITRIVDVSADEIEYIENLDMLIINDFDMSSLSSDDISKIKQRVESGALAVIGTEGEYESQDWFKALTGGAEATPYQVQSPVKTDENAAYEFAVNTIENSSIDEYGIANLESLCNFFTDDDMYKLVSLIYYYDDTSEETAQAVADRVYTSSGNDWITDSRKALNDMYYAAQNNEDFKMYDYVQQGIENSANTGMSSYASAYDPAEINNCFYVGDGMVATGPRDEIAINPIKIDFKPASVDPSRKNKNYFDLEKPEEILGSLFLAGIMLYSIFIGPFLFLILKKKDKREEAVKFIPLSALAVTAIIIVCSMGSKFQRPLANVVNLVQLGESGIRQTDSYIAVSSPSKGKINISADSINSALPLTKNSWDGNYDTGGYSASLTNFDYTYKDQTKWDTKKYKFNGSIELNGGLDVKLLDYDSISNTLKVELTNHTGYDLEDICAASGGTYYYEDRIEKKLKNGETATCDIVTSNLNNYVGFNMQNDAANGFNTMTSNKRAAINALKNDELVIVGFIKNNNTGDIKVNGRKASKTEITAVYTYIGLVSEYDYATLGGIDDTTGGIYGTN